MARTIAAICIAVSALLLYAVTMLAAFVKPYLTTSEFMGMSAGSAVFINHDQPQVGDIVTVKVNDQMSSAWVVSVPNHDQVVIGNGLPGNDPFAVKVSDVTGVASMVIPHWLLLHIMTGVVLVTSLVVWYYLTFRRRIDPPTINFTVPTPAP